MAPIIFWNGLYCAKRKQWNLVERRIRVHFGRKKLWELNVKFAVLRPMGWHGESGSANWGGHVTVDFRMQAHIHVSTHHVYCTEAAYGGQEETMGPSHNFRVFHYLSRKTWTLVTQSPQCHVTIATVIGVAQLAFGRVPWQ
ncbi:hypothetical protein EDB85DRAFT_1889823 [Lactarius pseudohatsudake]|nr:hypothetical protein EDB85DRAFT_1889823 [Lactarius pseudohatsudake]